MNAPIEKIGYMKSNQTYVIDCYPLAGICTTFVVTEEISQKGQEGEFKVICQVWAGDQMLRKFTATNKEYGMHSWQVKSMSEESLSGKLTELEEKIILGFLSATTCLNN